MTTSRELIMNDAPATHTSRPTAIITSGGGMRCAYSGGALVALAKNLHVTKPDYFVSVSGSVAAMFYYLSGQYDNIEAAWTRYIASSNFIRYMPLPQMRIDYLVDTIFKQYNPLDLPKLESAETKYFIPLTEHDTGFTRFVSNETWFNPYEVMRAAKAIPIFYNHSVRLGGSTYLDGDISTGTVTLIQKAIDAGAKKILVITNNHDRTRKGDFAVRMYARTLPKLLRQTVLNDLKEVPIPVWPTDVELMFLSPSVELPAKLYTRNRRKVVESYHIGYGDMMARQEEVAAFFNGV